MFYRQYSLIKVLLIEVLASPKQKGARIMAVNDTRSVFL